MNHVAHDGQSNNRGLKWRWTPIRSRNLLTLPFFVVSSKTFFSLLRRIRRESRLGGREPFPACSIGIRLRGVII
jgi:hypothetical protein